MNMGFISAVKHKDSLYWMTRDVGLFAKMDLNKKKISYLAPRGIEMIDTQYSAVCGTNEEDVFGICKSGKYFFRYNTRNDCFDYKEINLDKYALDWAVYSAYKGKELIIIGDNTDGIIRINVETGNTDYNSFSEHNKSKSRVLRNYINLGEKCVFFDIENNEEIILFLNDLTYERKRLPFSINDIEDVVCRDGTYIFLDSTGAVFTWDKDNGKEIVVELSEYSGTTDFGRLISAGDKLWILPKFKDKFIQYDYKTNTINEVIAYPEGTKIKNINVFNRCPALVRISTNEVWLGMYGTNCILALDSFDGHSEFIVIDDDERMEINNMWRRNISYFDERDLSIESYLDFIQGDNI